MIPPTLSNVRKIKRIAPVQLGKMLALVYGIMGLLFVPVFLVGALAASHLPQQQRVGILAMGTGFALCMPLLYALMGLIVGLLGAVIYNLVARWVGGIEVEVE
jgi:hypothetical protein